MNQFDSEKDGTIKKAFEEMMICDERIRSDREQRNSILDELAEDVDAEVPELRAAYRLYVKALEGDDKPTNRTESALNIANRLANI